MQIFNENKWKKKVKRIVGTLKIFIDYINTVHGKYISNKCYSFELSIYQEFWKKVSLFPINQHNCFQHS